MRAAESGFSIRQAVPGDSNAVLALMPRLADFAVPAERNPAHLWGDDADLFRRWVAGDEPCIVHVAEAGDGRILGFSMVRLRPELLSHEPSAHLEAIAVHRSAEGRGIARALLDEAESAARAGGAASMTLHVFACNRRAREFYDRAGYDGELMRYIKRFAE